MTINNGIGARPGMKKILPLLALTLSVFGIASAPILVRVSEVDPSATLMLRMFCASAIMATMPVLGSWKVEAQAETPWSRGKTALLVVISGLIFSLDLLANHWAVVLTSVANTTLLMNTTPIFALIISSIFFGETISRHKVASLTVAVMGGALLLGESIHEVRASSSILGDSLALFSALLYACYLNITKDLRARLSTQTIIFINSLICAIVLMPLVLATSGAILPTTILGYATILTLALVSQIMGHGMMAYALRHVEASLASITSLVRPAVSILLAWGFLAEPISLIQAVGGFLILTAVFFFNR